MTSDDTIIQLHVFARLPPKIILAIMILLRLKFGGSLSLAELVVFTMQVFGLLVALSFFSYRLSEARSPKASECVGFSKRKVVAVKEPTGLVYRLRLLGPRLRPGSYIDRDLHNRTSYGLHRPPPWILPPALKTFKSLILDIGWGLPLSAYFSACLARLLSGSIGSCRSYGAMTRANANNGHGRFGQIGLIDIVPSSRSHMIGLEMH